MRIHMGHRSRAAGMGDAPLRRIQIVSRELEDPAGPGVPSGIPG
jgi:hypothetical protein